MSIVLKLTLETLGYLAISLQMVLKQNDKKQVPNRIANSALLRAMTPIVNTSMWSREEKRRKKPNPNKIQHKNTTPFADKSTSGSIHIIKFNIAMISIHGK